MNNDIYIIPNNKQSHETGKVKIKNANYVYNKNFVFKNIPQIRLNDCKRKKPCFLQKCRDFNSHSFLSILDCIFANYKIMPYFLKIEVQLNKLLYILYLINKRIFFCKVRHLTCLNLQIDGVFILIYLIVTLFYSINATAIWFQFLTSANLRIFN